MEKDVTEEKQAMPDFIDELDFMEELIFEEEKFIEKGLLPTKYCASGKAKAISQFSRRELLNSIPCLRGWHVDKFTSDFNRSRPETQDQIRKEQQARKEGKKLTHKDKQVTTTNVYTGVRNMSSSLITFFSFWKIYEDLPPDVAMVYDHTKVILFLQWLRRYYPRGNTVRNKCQHMVGFLRYLKTVPGFATDLEIRRRIKLCKGIINQAAQNGKIEGTRQKADKENEEQLHSKGKFFTAEEGKTAYQWFCLQWAKYLPTFLRQKKRQQATAAAASTANIDDDDNDDDPLLAAIKPPTSLELRDQAFLMQRLLMARLFYLGGGQRRQVYANIQAQDISWRQGKMVLYVPAEKVVRLHTCYLPLPSQLYASIEFYIQCVWPYLLPDPADATNKKLLLWRYHDGGAMEPPDFSKQIHQAYQEFNPDLNITPIEFRHMTVTNLFAERIHKRDDETQEQFFQRHANLLNVSKSVMETHYNRFSRQDEYEQTLNAINTDVNLSERELRV